jgi:hypothetical protein
VARVGAIEAVISVGALKQGADFKLISGGIANRIWARPHAVSPREKDIGQVDTPQNHRVLYTSANGGKYGKPFWQSSDIIKKVRIGLWYKRMALFHPVSLFRQI